MSIESKVFEKLFTPDKLELASQKVELAKGDLSEIEGNVQKILSDFTKSKDIVQQKQIEYRLAYKTYEKQISTLKSSAIQLEGDLENVASALAAMGIQGNNVDGFQKAKQKVDILMKTIQDGESNLTKYKNPIL
jgi:vacuolar-type H+-ATPase subunit I/STV1